MVDGMRDNPSTIIIGQGVTDFKGIFGTVTGLAEEFPERVIETPLAEDSIAGVCIGAALNGLYPINTHIRADFGLLIFNQLINLAAKYRYMFGGLFEVPCMFRMVIGRSWGQGAQHSQSLQSLMAHVPGLEVLMPSSPASIRSSYDHAINQHRGPVVMLEHRLMYDLEFDAEQSQHVPFGSKVVRKGSDITIVAVSIMVIEAVRAAHFLDNQGISVEIIDVHNISNLDEGLLLESIKKTGRLLVLDTSWIRYGIAGEISRIIASKATSALSMPMEALGMAPAPCPTAKALEDIYYPDVSDIVEKTYGLLLNNESHSKPIPEKQSMADFYKHFKGPF